MPATRHSEERRLDLGGQSPDSLSIAEYLKVLGNVSSRPAAPSGTVLKAIEQEGDAGEVLWEGRAQPSPPAVSEQAPFAESPQDAGKANTIPSGQSDATLP